jgi:hypothetical protein
MDNVQLTVYKCAVIVNPAEEWDNTNGRALRALASIFSFSCRKRFSCFIRTVINIRRNSCRVKRFYRKKSSLLMI